MKCWKSCWITSGTSVQWDRTWTGIIDFDTHSRACVCRENPVWNVYIGSYTIIEAIKAFLFPVKLCAVLKSNWTAPYCLHEGLHSLIWKVLQHFKSCLKTLGGSIPSPSFSPGCLNVSGFWLWNGMDCWPVPYATWHAKDKGSGRYFQKECGLWWDRACPRFGKESHHVIGEVHVKHKEEKTVWWQQV